MSTLFFAFFFIFSDLFFRFTYILITVSAIITEAADPDLHKISREI